MPNRIEATARKPRQEPPGDYRYCACSRLHSKLLNERQRLASPRRISSLLAGEVRSPVRSGNFKNLAVQMTTHGNPKEVAVILIVTLI